MKNKVSKYNDQKKVWEYEEKDQLSFRIDFTWRITNNLCAIDIPVKTSGYLKNGEYKLTFNQKPTRPIQELGIARTNPELVNKLNPKDEMIITQVGQFLRVGGEALLREFAEKYNIK
jgi:hypothetical protein